MSKHCNSSYRANRFFVFGIAAFITLFYSCAQVVTPGGGKKDIIPPRVTKYQPDSAQLNFNSKTIQINFDEFVQLKDLNNQLIISPPLKTTPDISIKNKTLTLVFDKKDTLKPNTTYGISFGNSVQDITENNPIDNFKYLFSTGSYIDSCSLKGKVELGFNHSVEKGVMVMLYSRFDDSIVYKQLPDYFAKTKDDGSFQISNVKNGKYKLVVLKDANSNYKYDGESESIGFIDEAIDITKNENVLVELFQEIPKKLFLKKNTYDSYGKILFVFNKAADSVQINPIDFTFKDNDVLLQYSRNKDSLTYWFRGIDKEVLKLQLKNGNKILDTLEYKLITKEDALKSKRNKLGLYLTNNFSGNQALDLNTVFNFQLSQPIQKVGEYLFLRADTSLVKSKIETSSSVTGRDNFFKPYDVKLKESTKYHFLIPAGTFTDFFGLTNDSIKIDFKTQDEKYYGTVKLKLNVPSGKGQYVLQLLDDKENVVRQTVVGATQTILFDYLHPQQYKLKIIVDDNKNGKWDTGNYLKKQQPEKVIYYTGNITIRSNWDLDLEWKLSAEK